MFLFFIKIINYCNMDLSNVKMVVFDMDGVLRVGSKVIPGAQNIFRTLKSKGIKTMIVTNECRYGEKVLRDDLTEMGVKLPDDTKIITSGMSVYKYLKKKVERFSEDHFYIGILGESGLYNTLTKICKFKNVDLCEEPPEDFDEERSRLLLVIGTLDKIKIANLEKALKWVNAGCKIIITCDDMSDPSSKGDFSIGMPKHTLHMINFTVKTNYYSLGKPNPMISELIRKECDGETKIEDNEILFVGDTIYTDIKLAEESGFRSALVLSGNTKQEAIKNYVTEADMVFDSVLELERAFLDLSK